MDLLCTENIMHDYESENLYQQHLQAVKQQQQQQQVTTTQLPSKQQQQPTSHNILNPDGGSPAYSNNGYLLSSTSSISSTSSSASSGYNSVTSSSSSSSGSGSTRHDSTSSCNSATSCQNTIVASASGANDHHHHHNHNHQKQIQGQQQQQQPTYVQQQQQQQQSMQPQPQQPPPPREQQQQQSMANNAYTNNLINRTLDYVNTATEDPTFLSDRCLENALKAEQKQPQPVCTYFKTVQKDITPPMRKIVADWMMEVCAEEKCQEEVVLLALNYMDRFLSTKSVRKTHLQILAAACLLLASKLREPSCRALSAELLVFYTDNSIYKGDLIKWELFVLSRLGWDLSSVTPLDFLELLLIRLPIRSNICPDLSVDKVRQHAQAFISLAAKEHFFSIYSASTIAAASIAAALSGLNWHLRTGQNLRYLLNLLSELTTVKQNFLHDCMMKMEHVFEEHSQNLQSFLETQVPQQKTTSTLQQQQQQQLSIENDEEENQEMPEVQCRLNGNITSLSHGAQKSSATTTTTSSSSSTNTTSNSISSSNNNSSCSSSNAMLPDLTQTCKMQANTQKDVQDIKF